VCEINGGQHLSQQQKRDQDHVFLGRKKKGEERKEVCVIFFEFLFFPVRGPSSAAMGHGERSGKASSPKASCGGLVGRTRGLCITFSVAIVAVLAVGIAVSVAVYYHVSASGVCHSVWRASVGVLLATDDSDGGVCRVCQLCPAPRSSCAALLTPLKTCSRGIVRGGVP
jgi:hypothetical protein